MVAASTLGQVGRITGIGGFFFRARDPDALAVWYEERLGVKPAPVRMVRSRGAKRRV